MLNMQAAVMPAMLSARLTLVVEFEFFWVFKIYREILIRLNKIKGINYQCDN
jgi:hypothetical protein